MFIDDTKVDEMVISVDNVVFGILGKSEVEGLIEVVVEGKVDERGNLVDRVVSVSGILGKTEVKGLNEGVVEGEFNEKGNLVESVSILLGKSVLTGTNDFIVKAEFEEAINLVDSVVLLVLGKSVVAGLNLDVEGKLDLDILVLVENGEVDFDPIFLVVLGKSDAEDSNTILVIVFFVNFVDGNCKFVEELEDLIEISVDVIEWVEIDVIEDMMLEECDAVCFIEEILVG